MKAPDTPLRRFLAWLDMHLVDHGFVRAIYNNFYDLGGGMFRSSQPSPAQIRKYHRKYGLKTIINLRGEHDYGSYFFEKEVCEELGIALHDVKLYSRNPPEVAAQSAGSASTGRPSPWKGHRHRTSPASSDKR